MTSPSVSHDLKTLIRSFHAIIVVETVEEQRLKAQLRALTAELGVDLFTWTITGGLRRWPATKGVHGSTDPAHLLKHMEHLTATGVFLLKDFHAHLSAPVVVRKLREVAQFFAKRGSTIVLSGDSVKLPKEVQHLATYYELALPGVTELREEVENVVRSLDKKHKIRVSIRRADFDELMRALSGMTLSQARQTIAYCVLEDGVLSADDVRVVIERKARTIRDGGLLEYYPAEANVFQLGGFEKLKAWLERAKVGFSEEARELNLAPPRGILLVGIQGCGKSLAAKVTARQWNLPLLKLDAGRLFDKYIGESEKNFRRAISLAETIAPVVLWIDEIEKGMAPTSSGEADGGLSRRLFGAFLTWLQEKKQEVFVVATANDLSVLPPELLRKGRFDEIFFVDLPDPCERKTIFKIHLGLRRQDPTALDLDRLVKATDGFSGAEIEQVVIAGLYRALHVKRQLDTDLLLQEIGETIPLSVSRREDLERLRETSRGRFVPVK